MGMMVTYFLGLGEGLKKHTQAKGIKPPLAFDELSTNFSTVSNIRYRA